MGAKSRAVKRLKKDRSVSSTVHVPAVTDPDHRHRLGCVIDRVEDAVVPLADPILLLPGQLLHALGSRRHGKSRDLSGDQAANFRREALEFLGGRYSVKTFERGDVPHTPQRAHWNPPRVQWSTH